ncbi:RagB/SusD family nutrient uptake outer membrane protein [Chitinophaga sp. sic0106]|uniref:RagB/SusD family nutrient uptake outer membrane protein n=1 Tax=Chitinophaga sp. sic0106 TaxID=2854785 RepID=UPI001C44C801|nr:RagB/SusD family nutrient uptake outer membrane protein [Chitinophaga sp. sic0106]MBV7530380.1 RagB/SusD family nutrient uptake outer membrane protein [Chitinophaga sp. sic0106]
MKTLNRIILCAMLCAPVVSCKRDFLNEKALSFLSTSNAFKNAEDFNASVNNLYALVRTEFYTSSDWQPMHYLYRTDLAIEVAVGSNPNLAADFGPSGGLPNNHWNQIYKIIAEANTVISRIPASSMSASDKTMFEAKARFFRAFGYRTLAYLFGGVPLELNEVVTEKINYTRATKEEVLAQVITDLKFAAEKLPGITAVKDGEISNLVAQHLLSEVYLAAGQFQNAVTAASVVIDDPATDLMKTRFGSRSTVTPGDVYWDLFQAKNQNRKSAGNTEGLWVIQLETDVLGGSAVSTGMAGNYQLERVHVPLYRDMKVNGIGLFQWPVGDYTGGRGVGFMQPSRHYEDDIWQSDFANDIRNANNNFVREVVATNPLSPFFGQVISTRNPPAGAGITFPSRVFYPYQSKATTPFNHPTALYANPGSTDPIKKYELKTSAGGTYADQYMFRLAETYLLRAEGYLGLGNTGAAAQDINVVRGRSNASAAQAGQVNIDYILDERLREFGVEEKRMLTLMRLGLLYDRVTRYNPFYAGNMQTRFNRWAIPQGEIERNRGAVLEQNEGYK